MCRLLLLISLLLSSAKNSSQWLNSFCNGRFVHLEEKLNLNSRCSSDHDMHMQLRQTFHKANYVLSITINDTAGIEDLLLHICDGHGSFLSVNTGSVQSCRYDNDTFNMESQNKMHNFEIPLSIPLDHLKENAIINPLVLLFEVGPGTFPGRKSPHYLRNLNKRKKIALQLGCALIAELHSDTIKPSSTAQRIYFIWSMEKTCFIEGKKTFKTNFKMSKKQNGEILHGRLRYKRQASLDEESYFLVAHTDKIYKLSLNGDDKQSPVTDLRAAVALDYDLMRRKLYWTDLSRKVLMQSNLDGSGIITLLTVGILVPDGLAVDWTTNKLYFTDTGLDLIVVFDPTQFFYKTLINTGLNTEPRAIVLDPTTRYMYWTDWGRVARIERASMDGINRQVLHNTSLVWPNGISLDIQTQTLYWVDAGLDRVETSRVDGSLRRVLANTGLSHPFGIVVHDNMLYISDWDGNSIRVMNTSSGSPQILTNVSACARLFGISVVSPNRQLTAYNPCNINNGGCSHLCLLSTAVSGYSCACPDGMILFGSSCTASINDSVYVVPERVVPGSCVLAGYASSCCRSGTCQGLPENCYCDANCHVFLDCCSDVHNSCLRQEKNPYLVVAEARSMRLVDANNLSRFRTMLSNLNNSYSVTYHYRRNLLFWSDISTFRGIWKSNLDGTEVAPLLLSSTIISGITVDSTSDKLYWGDYSLNTINVMDLAARNQTTLVQVNSTYRPIQVIADPKSRYLFWGTQTAEDDGGVIYRASMDGGRSGDAILVTSSRAVSIAFDSSSDILYWTTGNVLGSVLINGSNLRVFTHQLPPTFKYLTLVSSNVLLMTYGYNATLIYTNGTVKQNSTEYSGCYNFRFSTLINPRKDNRDISRLTLPLKVIDDCFPKEDQHNLLLDVIKILQSEFNVNSIGLAEEYSASSCSDISRSAPLRKPGFYWIRSGNNVIKQFCEL